MFDLISGNLVNFPSHLSNMNGPSVQIKKLVTTIDKSHPMY